MRYEDWLRQAKGLSPLVEGTPDAILSVEPYPRRMKSGSNSTYRRQAIVRKQGKRQLMLLDPKEGV